MIDSPVTVGSCCAQEEIPELKGARVSEHVHYYAGRWFCLSENVLKSPPEKQRNGKYADSSPQVDNYANVHRRGGRGRARPAWTGIIIVWEHA